METQTHIKKSNRIKHDKTIDEYNNLKTQLRLKITTIYQYILSLYQTHYNNQSNFRIKMAQLSYSKIIQTINYYFDIKAIKPIQYFSQLKDNSFSRLISDMKNHLKQFESIYIIHDQKKYQNMKEIIENYIQQLNELNSTIKEQELYVKHIEEQNYQLNKPTDNF